MAADDLLAEIRLHLLVLVSGTSRLLLLLEWLLRLLERLRYLGDEQARSMSKNRQSLNVASNLTIKQFRSRGTYVAVEVYIFTNISMKKTDREETQREIIVEQEGKIMF